MKEVLTWDQDSGGWIKIFFLSMVSSNAWTTSVALHEFDWASFKCHLSLCLALKEVPTSTLLQVGMGVESCPSSLASHSHCTVHTAPLSSFSLFPKEMLGAFSPSGCCRAGGLEADLSAPAPHSQGAANTAAPKSEAEAVSAQHCAGCTWAAETQI